MPMRIASSPRLSTTALRYTDWPSGGAGSSSRSQRAGKLQAEPIAIAAVARRFSERAIESDHQPYRLIVVLESEPADGRHRRLVDCLARIAGISRRRLLDGTFNQRQHARPLLPPESGGDDHERDQHRGRRDTAQQANPAA
ncbi:MAG: hypothetical protein U5K73_09150 [Halofilum sp. (in: g-proteobacteria)]|nr:hypothetical protein [Halofilum sp. (in: g-proteobacteria)]